MLDIPGNLSRRWGRDAHALLGANSLGLTGGAWELDAGSVLHVPPLPHVRLVVNLAPIRSHTVWTDGRQRRSDATRVGALRIAPPDETAKALIEGQRFRFAQLYLPQVALRDIAMRSDRAAHPVHLRDPNFDESDPLIASLLDALLAPHDDPDATLYRDHLSLALLARLVRRYGRVDASLPAGGLGSARLRDVLEYIDAHLDEPLTVEALATTAGLSAFHFARSFRKATGVPPHAYVRRLRIERAKRLLTGTRSSVTAIALECGYATPSSFAAAYQQATGVTPTDWRRRTAR